MVLKPQKTKFQVSVIDNFDSLSQWAVNPWRRYSLALTVVLTGYFFGSSLGMISAVVELIAVSYTHLTLPTIYSV